MLGRCTSINGVHARRYTFILKLLMDRPSGVSCILHQRRLRRAMTLNGDAFKQQVLLVFLSVIRSIFEGRHRKLGFQITHWLLVARQH